MVISLSMVVRSNVKPKLDNFSDNDFIWTGLGGMGYNQRLYKKIISNCKFIRSRFQTIFFKNKHLQVAMFQNVLMDPKILKEKQISLFFQCLLESLCHFPKKINLCVFPISYKCKYVLFHLNMLKLFQEINKKISLRLS